MPSGISAKVRSSIQTFFPVFRENCFISSMKFHGVISKISYRKLELPMVKPFRIAIGSTNSYEGFLVSVTTDDGITGFGEATTTPFITGDTIGSIEYELRSFSETLVGKEESPEILNEFMKSTLRSSKASRNAIDCAVWDIIGKRSRTNVRKMLGNYRKKISTFRHTSGKLY